MMAGPGEMGSAGGGPARHIPVLLKEVLAAVAPRGGMTIIDGTFGAGGYSQALIDAGANVVAVDRDPDAIAAGRAMEAQSGGRLRLVEGAFSNLDSYADDPVDAVVLDIGVSSMQLDQAERGFSFRHDGPLDMRMDKRGMSAADVVNSFKSSDLTRIFGLLGEERHAGRIARMIERRREARPFLRTLDLADAIEATVGRGPKDKIHPATRCFQALRIFVNDELGELGRALFAAEHVLKPGGRLVVVTFHSLEDRMVKRFFVDRAGGTGGSRHLPEKQTRIATFDKADKVVAASDGEAAANPRARSAKLRAATRTAAPAGEQDHSIFGLPRLPEVNIAAERR
ncbi:16S rRNA (cytosine(1402)-N(4))-methyltransferase RsmH [Mesorhizobium xinjiangense]|uniref:16S rRNA (cytosine(1402)-N(4))-methyltransferase RsmH n=1 Tax=Mesorhizobium xinjiangense TaxID=2678685 RepID=UPI0012EE4908|nr:16S rRNA (cytosine(1402)-N(4))-methyltransferase RsmH [Mesorhizobium xinjiangense]